MTDHNQAIRDDIAFMRSLAEAGRQAPLKGGSILMAAGLIYAACAFATWFAASYPVSPLFMPTLWFGGTGLFFVALFALRRRMGAKTETNRAAGLIWAGAGWALFVIVLSLMLMGYRANGWWIMAAICPIVLATYGAAWTVAGILTQAGWMRGVGFGAFAMALVCAWYGLEVRTLFLIYGVSLLGLVALPGYLAMRQAQRAAA
ncbi:hypothetical protein [Phenylobacterium sp.]|uniref:hypothetical protein n=1 Tax=Phenylobacterium sp. TaxID=1871053 RepID=UPI002DE7A918|nr:hypothetical protein [Phenylobacterium sp.]